MAADCPSTRFFGSATTTLDTVSKREQKVYDTAKPETFDEWWTYARGELDLQGVLDALTQGPPTAKDIGDTILHIERT